MKPCLPVHRTTSRQLTRVASVLLAIEVSVAPTAAAQATDPREILPVPEETTACSAAPEPLPEWLRLEPQAAPADATRSLVLAVKLKVGGEDAEHLAWRLLDGTPPAASSLKRFRLAYSGRAWPFALAATADAVTTHWALGRGASERNPLLAVGRVDLTMAKIVQFPLLALAIDSLEAAHPRWGRVLRWGILAFHAALAVNNVRLGRAVDPSHLGARARR
jgi:hypothetical protein